MKKISDNPCFRCGKQRIVTKTWKETITTFSGMEQKVEFSDSVCPDAACQNMLNEELEKQKDKRDKITQDRTQRMVDQKARMSARRKVV